MKRTDNDSRTKNFFTSADFLTRLGRVTMDDIFREVRNRKLAYDNSEYSLWYIRPETTHKNINGRGYEIFGWPILDLDGIEDEKEKRKLWDKEHWKMFEELFPVAYWSRIFDYHNSWAVENLECLESTFEQQAYQYLDHMLNHRFFSETVSRGYDADKFANESVAHRYIRKINKEIADKVNKFGSHLIKKRRQKKDGYYFDKIDSVTEIQNLSMRLSTHIYEKYYDKAFLGMRDNEGNWMFDWDKVGEKVIVGFNECDQERIRCNKVNHDQIHPHLDYKNARTCLVITQWGNSLYLPITPEWYNIVNEHIAVVEQNFVIKAEYLDAESSDTFSYWKAKYIKKSYGRKTGDPYYFTLVDGYIGRYASDEGSKEPLALRCSPSLSGVKKKIENRASSTVAQNILNSIAD